MTMKMNETRAKLLAIIREALEFNKSGNNKVELYEETLFAAGFLRQDIERGLKKLTDEHVIQTLQIFYAPEKTLSNYAPESGTKYKVPADNIYKIPVYIFYVDEQKLEQPDPSEPLWFDKEKGVLHFKGRSCDISGILESDVLFALLKYPTGKSVSETDIAELVDPEKDMGSSIRDASRRVNAKVKQGLGIEELIRYRNSNYWLKPD